MGNRSSWLQEPDSEVKLLWVRHSVQLYKRLSLNITREVCTYVRNSHVLIAVQPHRVVTFSLDTLQPVSLFELRERVVVGSGAAFCMVGEKKVFLCGGGEEELDCKAYIDSNTAFVLKESGVKLLPSLKDSLRAPGLYFHRARNSVYVFGGRDRYGKSLDSAQTLPLKAASNWQCLPTMSNARAFFNPCATESLVFLVGGWTTSIETYSLITHNFTLFELELPIDFARSACTAVLNAYSVIALAPTMLCEAEEHCTRWKRTQEVQLQSTWSNCRPWVQGGRVYVVSMLYGVCRGVDLTCGLETCVESFIAC